MDELNCNISKRSTAEEEGHKKGVGALHQDNSGAMGRKLPSRDRLLRQREDVVDRLTWNDDLDQVS
jgi:hypothetical protein